MSNRFFKHKPSLRGQGRLAAMIVVAVLCGCGVTAGVCRAGEPVKLADGKLTMAAPDGWEKKEPRTRIVEVEFAVPPKEGETMAARLTMMASGGGVEANIDRWIGQFSQPDNKPTKAVTKVEKLEIDGATVHIVDIAGNFKDQPRGPMGPTVIQESYRMLGAIIEAKGTGVYYIKMYGPAATVHQNEDAFRGMIKSLDVAN